MNSIWLTGPSALGKSTFIKKFCEQNKEIQPYKEITRSNLSILNTPFATRQLFFGLNYVNRHRSSITKSFISDRTILDYIFWTIYDSKITEFDNTIIFANFMPIIEDYFDDSDIFIVIKPPESYEDFKRLIFPNYLSDPLRHSIYISKYNDIYGYPPYTHDDLCNFVFHMSLDMYTNINNSLSTLKKMGKIKTF